MKPKFPRVLGSLQATYNKLMRNSLEKTAQCMLPAMLSPFYPVLNETYRYNPPESRPPSKLLHRIEQWS
jgi:hypothetical protein